MRIVSTCGGLIRTAPGCTTPFAENASRTLKPENKPEPGDRERERERERELSRVAGGYLKLLDSEYENQVTGSDNGACRVRSHGCGSELNDELDHQDLYP